MIFRAELVRRAVAPEPTGSRMMGILRAEAIFPALTMESTHSSVRVPIFNTRAPARQTISSTSFGAWAITGEAPIAKRALAV